MMDILSATSQPVPTKSASPKSTWQKSMRLAVRDLGELCERLGLRPEDLPMIDERLQGVAQAMSQFPLFVPREFVARMKPDDPRDPLLLQVLPQPAEMHEVTGFVPDAVNDTAAEVIPGLLRKYSGRALLVVTGACAIHCRYCFRRHFPYEKAPTGIEAWLPAFDEITKDPSLDEVILSGGDPLTMTDAWLSRLIERIESIDHIRRLRVHTRLPVMIPARVTTSLIQMLKNSSLTPIIVLHVNHANELNCPEVRTAIHRLANAGIPLLNQAVLLKGINDRVEDLEQLCRDLVDNRVMPYYLHQLDRVTGAAHFEVAEEIGKELMSELRKRLPGYAVPRYVREIAGATSKSPMEEIA